MEGTLRAKPLRTNRTGSAARSERFGSASPDTAPPRRGKGEGRKQRVESKSRGSGGGEAGGRGIGVEKAEMLKAEI